MDDAWVAHKRKLYSVSQSEWFALAAIFAAKPGKDYIEVMRSVMIVSSFVLVVPACVISTHLYLCLCLCLFVSTRNRGEAR